MAEQDYRCEVCGKKTSWANQKYCTEHKSECKHESAMYVPTGDDVCRDCGLVW